MKKLKVTVQIPTNEEARQVKIKLLDVLIPGLGELESYPRANNGCFSK